VEQRKWWRSGTCDFLEGRGSTKGQFGESGNVKGVITVYPIV
jgi:hypothetical protein